MRRKDEQNKERLRKNFDNRRGARELLQFQTGDPVWLPDKEVEGMAGEEVAPHSFNVLSRCRAREPASAYARKKGNRP